MSKDQQVIGSQCSFVFDLSFAAIAEKLALTVDDIRWMWNEALLEDYINENLTVFEVLQLADKEPLAIEVRVGDGWLEPIPWQGEPAPPAAISESDEYF